MAPKSKTGGTPVKLERPQKFQQMMYNNILQSQQTDANGDLADTVLICDGGTIRVHAFLLQAASPLIQKAVESQGENYPYIREILLPDFPVKSIERMLSLVYKGYADLPTDEDVESLKEVLKFFEISSVDFNLDEDNEKNCKSVQGALKVQELNRIPQDIFKMGGSLGSSSSKAGVKGKKKEGAKVKDGQGSSQQAVRRSGRPQKPVMKLKDQDGNGEKSDDPDFSGNSSSSDDDERSDDESKPKRGRRPGSKQPVVVKASTSPSKNVTTPSGSKSIGGDKKGVSNVSSGKNSSAVSVPVSKREDDSSTDTEDENWVKPNFKDKDWFAKESTRCQCCEKTFDVPAKAALCITSHKTLRCYFCFKVYSTTDILFRHFKKRHKQAGRENTLICPFCDNAVPYKSVSCHVISTHLSRKTSPEKPYGNVTSSTQSKTKSGSSTDKDVDKSGRASSSSKGGSSNSGRRRRSPSRSPSTDRASGNERKRKKQEQNSSPAKKGSQLKIRNLKSFKQKILENNKKKMQDKEKLEVRNLDVTIEKTTASGNRLVFRVQKQRPVLTNGNS